jgi:hypothetical protein
MTSTLLDPGTRFAAEAHASAPSRGGRMTLEERLQGTWHLLLAEGAADCPVCGDEMTLHGGAGECRGCGAKMK